MVVVPMRLVSFTTQLISRPDLPNSINEGSSSIDMEASTEIKNKKGFQNNFNLIEHKDFSLFIVLRSRDF